jgi:hypothetical protein
MQLSLFRGVFVAEVAVSFGRGWVYRFYGDNKVWRGAVNVGRV